MSFFADILLPLPIPNLFTYRVKPEQEAMIRPYVRVTVQFGKKKLYSGIIIAIHENEPTGYETKPIEDIIDTEPVINEFQWQLWQWIAGYYMCAPGEVMKAALPSGLRLESETRIFVNPGFENQDTLSDKEAMVLALLENNQSIQVGEVIRTLTDFSALPVLRKLQEKEAVFFEENIKEVYTPKVDSFVALTEKYQAEEK
ncbi:MAG: primosomal protein N', partial [Bacteroidota bacterium]